MSKNYFLLIVFIVGGILGEFKAKATNYTATANGAWNNNATWGGSGFPSSSADNATIPSGVTVTVSGTPSSVNNVTINGTGVLKCTTNINLNVYGNFTNNGSLNLTNGTVTFIGSGNQTLGGTSSSTFYNLTIANTGAAGSNTVTLGNSITANNALTLTSGILDVSTTPYSVTILNNFTNNATTSAFNAETGTVTFSAAGCVINGSSGTTFYNLAISGTVTANTTTAPVTVSNNITVNSGNSITFNPNSLTVNGTVTNNSGTIAFTSGTFTANGAVSNNGTGTISFNSGIFNANAGVTNAGTISFTAGTFNITGNLTNNGTVSFSGAGQMNITGNFTNNGTFNQSTGAVTFDGSSNQTINGTSSPTFNNLKQTQSAATDTLVLNIAITVGNNFTINQGVFNSYIYQVTGNAGGVLTMASGTTMLLGWKSIATAVNFPTAYVAANITLNSGSYVIYYANTNQTISDTPNYANLTITDATATTTNTLSSNVTINGNLLIQDGSGVVTFSAGTYSINLAGNLTDNGVFSAGTSIVTLNGSGVQALTSTEAGGLNFYDLVVNNSAATYPGLTTNVNLNVSDQLTYTSGNLDLQGKTLAVTTGETTTTTDNYSGGLIYSSVSGANLTVTDPNSILYSKFSGTWIGNSKIGVTQSVTSGEIQFTNFVEYGTATFTKIGAYSNSFGGGNGFHGPVTFNANSTTGLWKFGVSTTAPDTFYTATINANANLTGNDNFILGANNTETFYGTTTVSSTTPGGVYFGRSNGTGNASITFQGPVVCTIALTGNVIFADADAANVNNVTFNNTITLNSTATSTGFYYFGNSAYSSITLNTGGQFLTGSISGSTNVYLENVTQLGSTTQTINTAGSTGFLYIGGTQSASTSQPNTFNGTVNFTADTAGYFVNATYNGPSTITVNHAGANGYILSNTFNNTLTATVGNLRFQSNTFNGITSLQQTSTTSSTDNGGNSFNAAATIINSGTATLETGTFAADNFNNAVTFTENGTGACLIEPARTNVSNFAGNITVNGTSSNQMLFGSNGGGVNIDGSGTQVFTTSGSAVSPSINNLTMDMAAAGTNILQFSFASSSISLIGTLTFNSGNTGLINLNSETLTLGTSNVAPGSISYPAPPTVAGWVYGGTFSRWISSGASVALPTSTSIATAGFFPIGSSATNYDFEPFWFATSGTVKTANTLSISQTSTASGSTIITSYNDATWSGGTSVVGISNATWVVSPNVSLALNAGVTAEIMFGGFGFQPFVVGDVNASNVSGALGNFASPSQLYGTTDIEVERASLSLLQMTNTWYIGTHTRTVSPLPITLTSFTATCDNYAALLQWTTGTETNNKYFSIERTQDGTNYETIGTVEGAGTTTTGHNYSFIDETPLTGYSYYRLSQTDDDGNTTNLYSVVYSPCEGSNTINAFVSQGSLNINVQTSEADSYTILVTDELGRIILQQPYNVIPGTNTTKIYVRDSTPIFILQLIGKNKTFTRKLMSQ